MQIIIKCLKGGSTVIEVDETTPIAEIKNKVEKDLKIPISQQTLVLLGSPLQDGKKVGDYPKIKEGTKIYIVIKKPENLQSSLGKFLRRYYSEEQCKIIVDEFLRNFQNKVDNLSLDDLERIAISNLNV
ncbi:ubiquitin-like protein 4A [Sitophilus oryzae]|uniref:Ubiquitin-like protein 4A n=1 Tax=Sitophilus oryzae TaxID=7048 RepID=A0A6J2Y4G4_SITOR|nr:ubiquitin-like protein 4A [Sitophilus oryzae]